MQKTCAECDRLWEEYTQAARAHLTVVVQRHKAAIQHAAIHNTAIHNTAIHNAAGVVDEVSPAESDLAQQKLRARRAIGEHEAAHELLLKPAQ
jgi:hypothetical protein